MERYKNLYEEIKKECINDGIVVTETTLIQIKTRGAGLTGGIGFIDLDIDNNEELGIWVDENETDEMKLRITLHEFGHCLYYKKVGYKNLQTEKNINELQFKINSEYEAHKYQLERTKQIVESNGDFEFLKVTLKKFEEKKVGKTPEYKPAIEKLMAINLWTECTELVSTLENRI